MDWIKILAQLNAAFAGDLADGVTAFNDGVTTIVTELPGMVRKAANSSAQTFLNAVQAGKTVDEAAADAYDVLYNEAQSDERKIAVQLLNIVIAATRLAKGAGA